MKITLIAEKPYGATITVQQEGHGTAALYSITKAPEGFDPEQEDLQEPTAQVIDALDEGDARLLLRALTMLLGPEPQTVYSVGV